MRYNKQKSTRFCTERTAANEKTYPAAPYADIACVFRRGLPQLGVQAQVVTARAEEYVRTCRESYDIVTSRAVARLNVLAELCLPYAKVGGVFLAMKGALADEEIDEARRGIAQLGGSIERVYEYPIQDAVHKAVVIRKQKPTPPKYPRAFAKIKKSPL